MRRSSRSSSLHRLSVFLLLACGGVAGCNELLDIQEANVDPRFDDDGDAGKESNPQLSGGSSGAGGVSGSSGSSSGSGVGGGAGDTTAGNPGGAPASDGGESGASSAEPQAGAAGTGENSEGGTGGSAPTAGTSGAAGSSGTAGTMNEAGAAGAGPEPVSMCETYCAQITQSCSGTMEQYVDVQQCEKVCAYLPQGTLGETTGNTVACRLKQAADARYAAGTERGLICRRAGPGGDGVCGSNCEGFCSLMAGVCTAEDSPLYRFANTEACMATCSALPDGEVPYSTSNEAVSDGNSVQCRLFHVNSAAMLDPLEHCEHAMGVTLCETGNTEPHEH
jgi:hypothetical protein